MKTKVPFFLILLLLLSTSLNARKGDEDAEMFNPACQRDQQAMLLPLQSWGVVTKKGTKLYLHVFDWPRDKKLVVGGLKTLPEKAWLLADNSKKMLPVKKINSLDVMVNLPEFPTDKVNTVIALEMNRPVETDSIRLLSAKNPNRLLAFDAQLHGDGFRFGDGKTDRYYVDGWTKTNQSVSWYFRLNESAKVELSIRYQFDNQSGGIAAVSVGGQKFRLEIKPSGEKPEIRTVVVGRCTLKPGVHELTIQPGTISGKNIMLLFHADIKPIK